jgi:hypothetical protein
MIFASFLGYPQITAKRFSEKYVTIRKSTLNNIPEDLNFSPLL